MSKEPRPKKIECPCGWSRLVASTVRRQRRLELLAKHQETHAGGAGE